jgi:hypothetical protein
MKNLLLLLGLIFFSYNAIAEMPLPTSQSLEAVVILDDVGVTGKIFILENGIVKSTASELASLQKEPTLTFYKNPKNINESISSQFINIYFNFTEYVKKTYGESQKLTWKLVYTRAFATSGTERKVVDNWMKEVAKEATIVNLSDWMMDRLAKTYLSVLGDRKKEETVFWWVDSDENLIAVYWNKGVKGDNKFYIDKTVNNVGAAEWGNQLHKIQLLGFNDDIPGRALGRHIPTPVELQLAYLRHSSLFEKTILDKLNYLKGFGFKNHILVLSDSMKGSQNLLESLFKDDANEKFDMNVFLQTQNEPLRSLKLIEKIGALAENERGEIGYKSFTGAINLLDLAGALYKQKITIGGMNFSLLQVNRCDR